MKIITSIYHAMRIFVFKFSMTIFGRIVMMSDKTPICDSHEMTRYACQVYVMLTSGKNLSFLIPFLYLVLLSN